MAQTALPATPQLGHEEQPFADEASDLAIVADVRLDNRDELLHALGIEPTTKVGDGVLILRAYTCWGEACVDHLLGDFAFAVWDGRRHALFCARDPFGIRPLVYAALPGYFACASEVGMLQTLPGMPRQRDDLQVAAYILGTGAAEERTFLASVKRLPAAHTLTVTATGIRLRRYWSLSPRHTVCLSSDEAYAEAFRDLFGQAVASRLRGADPVGCMLSGGLDSSAVAGMARHLLPPTASPIRTFSLSYPDAPEMDERTWIEPILALGGFTHTDVPAGAITSLLDLDQLLLAGGEPAALTVNTFINWILYRLAARAGVRAVLDGFDGDIVAFRSWAREIELRRRGRWLTVLREYRHRRGDLVPWRQALSTGLVHPLFAPYRPDRAWNRWRERRRQLYPWPAAIPIAPALVERTGLVRYVAEMEAAGPRRWRTAQDLHYRLLVDVSSRQRTLEWGQTAAGAGVEQRSPFMDRRVVEFCLAVPPEQKYQYGWDRIMVRRGMEGLLPLSVQWRYGKPTSSRIMHPLLPFLRDRTRNLLSQPHEVWEYVDRDAVGRDLARSLVNPADAVTVRLWRTAALAHYLRAPTPVPPYPSPPAGPRRRGA